MKTHSRHIYRKIGVDNKKPSAPSSTATAPSAQGHQLTPPAIGASLPLTSAPEVYDSLRFPAKSCHSHDGFSRSEDYGGEVLPSVGDLPADRKAPQNQGAKEEI